MRLFLYYALHSFKNQVKKLFKTWMMLFILICAVVGGLIGFTIGYLTDDDQEDAVEYVEDYADSEEDADFEDLEETEDADFSSTLRDAGMDPSQLPELAAGLIILVMLLFEAFSADKSGNKIFLPADASLLFPSPMKPQSVLLFRLATKLGTFLLLSLYLLIELPTFISQLDLSFLTVVMLLLTWFLALAVAKLIQILLYTLASTHAGLKKAIRRIVYGIILVLAAMLIGVHASTGLPYGATAVKLFNAPATRYIPVWGWLKSIFIYALEGRFLLSGLFLVLMLATSGVLAWFIWHIRADFYEEALVQTEEMAEMLNAAQTSEDTRGGLLVKRKKDRSDKLRRDGLNHGSGAVMFFHKAMYNRFRFAHLGILTKTSETYLVAGIGAALISRYLMDNTSLTMTALVLAGLSFFRSLGNPLSQDTGMPFFRLIPDSSWKKLFYSVLGGTVNCLLDTAIALIPATILLRANPLSAVGWALFIASVDFYATVVGTFIDLSVNSSAGKIVKQLAQILFLYFGLIPDALLIFLGLRSDGLFFTYTVVACAINIAIGFIFLAVTPLFLEPASRIRVRAADLSEEDLKTARKHFSRLGMGPFVILVVGSLLQIAVMLVQVLLTKNGTAPAWMSATWFTWVGTFGPLYLVAVPVGLAILKKAPAKPLQKQSFGILRYLSLFPICIFLMYCGSIIGLVLTTLFGLLIPSSGVDLNPLMDLIQLDSMFWRVLIMVVFAPIIEEFIFRKTLIDRMHVYGQKRAIVLSAFMFGLFHGNFSQMFYAFLLGLVFGYVYLKTGKLRYSIILHMIINAMGSVVAPALLERIDLSDLDAMTISSPGIGLFFGYFGVLMILFILGLVLLCLRKRHVRFESAPLELPRRKAFRTTIVNVGMILFILGCLAEVVFSLL